MQLMHEMSWTANPTIYRPLEQDAPKRLEILTREKDGVKLHAMREQVAALDADVPVPDWETMETRLEETTKFARFRAVLVSSFALAAISACRNRASRRAGTTGGAATGRVWDSHGDRGAAA